MPRQGTVGIQGCMCRCSSLGYCRIDHSDKLCRSRYIHQCLSHKIKQIRWDVAFCFEVLIHVHLGWERTRSQLFAFSWTPERTEVGALERASVRSGNTRERNVSANNRMPGVLRVYHLSSMFAIKRGVAGLVAKFYLSPDILECLITSCYSETLH